MLARDMLGDLMQTIVALRGEEQTGSRLSAREREVLRLVAEGCPTARSRDRLSYPERTIKNVIHDVSTKLNARSRSQAVAEAVKAGLL